MIDKQKNASQDKTANAVGLSDLLCLRSEIEKKIEFSNNQNVRCENYGDKYGAESWHGYTNGLRWVLMKIDNIDKQT